MFATIAAVMNFAKDVAEIDNKFTDSQKNVTQAASAQFLTVPMVFLILGILLFVFLSCGLSTYFYFTRRAANLEETMVKRHQLENGVGCSESHFQATKPSTHELDKPKDVVKTSNEIDKQKSGAETTVVRNIPEMSIEQASDLKRVQIQRALREESQEQSNKGSEQVNEIAKDKDKEQETKVDVQQAAAPNIIILNYGGKDLGAGGKIIATNQGGNIILRPEGAPPGAALDAAIAAASGQQTAIDANKVGAETDTSKNPNAEEDLKKVSKLDPNYMTLVAFGNNDQIFEADKFSKEGETAPTDSNAPKPSTNVTESPNVPAPAPAVPFAASNPNSTDKATCAYATPGGNVVGGAVSVFSADGAQTGGASTGSLTPAPIGIPTPAVPATYTQSSGGKGAQSAYFN